jgi:hypothetical protein
MKITKQNTEQDAQFETLILRLTKTAGSLKHYIADRSVCVITSTPFLTLQVSRSKSLIADYYK